MEERKEIVGGMRRSQISELRSVLERLEGFLPFTPGFILLITVFALYVNYGIKEIRDTLLAADLEGKVVVVGPGDIAIRDVPKALTFQTGVFFGDPHYAGEVHWYPFLPPLIAATISTLFEKSIHVSYFVMAVIMSGLLLVAIGMLLHAHLGAIGFLMLPLGVLLGQFWPDNSMYPGSTGRLPFTFFLAVAGFLFHSVRNIPSFQPSKTNLLFLLLGLLNGVLGLWHGASFFTAVFVSAVIIVYFVTTRLRARGEQLAASFAPVAFYVVGIAATFGLLIVPQLLQYGHLLQSDAARFYLAGFENGNKPEAFFSLALLPSGVDCLFLSVFLLIFYRSDISTRLKALPLLIGYFVTKGLAHLGFVLYSIDYPWLSELSRVLLVCPPHTFNVLGDYIFVLVKLLVIGTITQSLFDQAANLLSAVGRGLVANFFLVGGILVTYGSLFLHFPKQVPLYTNGVDRSLYEFAQEASGFIGPKETVYQSNELIQYAPFKVLCLQYPAHANPYVQSSRAKAEGVLRSGIGDVHPRDLEDVLRKYNVRFMLVSPRNPDFTTPRLCGGVPLIEGPDGYKLVKLEPDCQRLDTMMQQMPLVERTREFNLMLDSESPLIIGGVTPGSADNLLEYARVSIENAAILQLQVRGEVIDNIPAICAVVPRAYFWGQEGPVGESYSGYSVEGLFQIDYKFIAPDNAIGLKPRLTFSKECFSGGGKIRIDEFTLYSEVSH